jgi:hypothetical protein
MMILYGPSHVGDQTIARVIRHPDGGAHIETWHKAHGWRRGGADFSEFIFARPVSPEMARRQNLSLEDNAA